MLCRDARKWLGGTQCNDSRALLLTPALQEHLKQCPACRAFQQSRLDGVLNTPAPLIRASISTSQIMRAVQEQKRVTQQLEEYPQQPRSRMERLRPIAAASLAVGLFALSSSPLFFFAILIVQTGLAAKILSLLSGIIDIFTVLAQYL